jgi:hypothetical protein
MKVMKLKKSFFAITVVLFAFLSCNNDTNVETSRVQLNLIDLEGEYEKVLVNIIDVQYNKNEDENGWSSFEGFTPPDTDDPQNRVDLTELIAGNSLVLTDEDIESGMLKQIRLILGDGNALVILGETEEIPLSTPSAQQSGLKLKVNTELEPGFSYTFILDWDVQKSIVKAGNSGNYNLKPVINVIAEVNSGSILGRVADSEETVDTLLPISDAVISVYDESDTLFETSLTSTNTDGVGNFVLQGLSEGNYKLKVEKTDYMTIESIEIIEVNKGVETDVETILLTQS